MNGDFVALHLSEDEYKRALELNKRFEVQYKPYLVIHILNHHSENVFEGLICNGTSFDIDNCIFTWNASIHTVVTDYYKKKNSVFTFDGISFFRIINVHEEAGTKLLYFTFQLPSIF